MRLVEVVLIHRMAYPDSPQLAYRDSRDLELRLLQL